LTRSAAKKPSRKLSPAEFQVLVAIHQLGRPTIREVRQFLAQFPPLSVSLRRSPGSPDTSRGIPPSYNNINTIVLRMLASGMVEIVDQAEDGSRYLVPLWDLEPALAHSVALAVRDYLVWKPLIPAALGAILDQISRRYSSDEEADLRRTLESEVAQALERWRSTAASDAHSSPTARRTRSSARSAKRT